MISEKAARVNADEIINDASFRVSNAVYEAASKFKDREHYGYVEDLAAHIQRAVVKAGWEFINARA